MVETNMMKESTKDKLVRLDVNVRTLQPNLKSLAKNMEINLTEMASVKQTCIEFMNEFLNKMDKVIGEVVVLVEVLKGDIRDLEKKMGC